MEGFNFNAIWITLLLLGIAVIVHEFGHFITARAFGVTVYEFSVGFGPLIAKFRRNNVQYSLRWIMLGGYCKIAGIDMALEGETQNAETRKEHLFQFLSLWKKIIILATGSLFNLLLGLIVYFGAIMIIGTPVTNSAGAPVIDSVIIEKVNAKSPAMEAGIKSGDEVVAINSIPIKRSTDVTKIVQQSAGQSLQIKISRHGQITIKTVTPEYSSENKMYLMGVRIMELPEFERASIQKAIKETVVLPWTTIKLLSQLIRGKIKGDLMGPVGAVDMVDQSLQLPPQIFYINIILFFCSISISLCLLNLLPLPLPVLDGGWIVILVLEKIFRREFSTEQKTAAYTIGLIAVLTLTAFITYGDLVRLIRRVLGG